MPLSGSSQLPLDVCFQLPERATIRLVKILVFICHNILYFMVKFVALLWKVQARGTRGELPSSNVFGTATRLHLHLHRCSSSRYERDAFFSTPSTSPSLGASQRASFRQSDTTPRPALLSGMHARTELPLRSMTANFDIFTAVIRAPSKIQASRYYGHILEMRTVVALSPSIKSIFLAIFPGHSVRLPPRKGR